MKLQIRKKVYKNEKSSQKAVAPVFIRNPRLRLTVFLRNYSQIIHRTRV